MRIAIFSDQFYPEMSGVCDSIIALGTELGRRGHYVHYFVPKYSPREYEIAGLATEDELNLGERVAITSFLSFGNKNTPNQQGRGVIPLPWRWHIAEKFKPDIIHTQLFYGVGLEALIASRKLRRPIIGTNHTAVRAFLDYMPIRAKWFGEKFIKYTNWYYGKCDLVTTPSRAILEEMQFDGFQKEAHAISNPIDTETFRPLPNKNWLKKKFGIGDYAIIHAGRMSAERNIDTIIKAMPLIRKKIPRAELILAGRGLIENDLKRLVELLGLNRSVRFLGFLDKPTLAEAYNASKVFAIASTSDTQSMVMMQAMASGLPIVGVKARALPEFINKYNGFVVPPNDEKMLAEKIIYLLENHDIRRSLGQGARKYSRQFSTKCIADEWEEIYEKVIKSYNK